MVDGPAILLDFPDAFESERLLIRGPRPGDGAEVHAALVESLDELRPWMPWALGEHTVEAAEAAVREAHADFLARRDLRLHLYRRTDGAFVGTAKIQGTNDLASVADGAAVWTDLLTFTAPAGNSGSKLAVVTAMRRMRLNVTAFTSGSVQGLLLA